MGVCACPGQGAGKQLTGQTKAGPFMLAKGLDRPVSGPRVWDISCCGGPINGCRDLRILTWPSTIASAGRAEPVFWLTRIFPSATRLVAKSKMKCSVRLLSVWWGTPIATGAVEMRACLPPKGRQYVTRQQ